MRFVFHVTPCESVILYQLQLTGLVEALVNFGKDSKYLSKTLYVIKFYAVNPFQR